MCISARASINAFLVNLVSAISLVYFGNENLKSLNIIIAIFSIFTSFMQLVDLGVWLDLDCKNGLNRMASLLGPTLLYLQPIMIFVLTYIIFNYTNHGIKYRKNNLVNTESNNPIYENLSLSSNKFNLIKIVNIIGSIILFILVTKHYINTKNNVCSELKDGFVNWKWVQKDKKYLSLFGIIYMFLVLTNFYLIDPESLYIKITLIVYVSLYVVSFIIGNEYKGEVWCLISNCVPLVLLIIQKLFKSQLKR